MYQMVKSNPDNLILFSAGQAEAKASTENTIEIEDKIYSRAELRQMDLDTSEYCFLNEEGTFYATLFLKAEAREAEEMLDLLIGELACKEGVSELVKAENQMAWVQKMNSIRNRAEEIILTELIYC